MAQLAATVLVIAGTAIVAFAIIGVLFGTPGDLGEGGLLIIGGFRAVIGLVLITAGLVVRRFARRSERLR
jgi:hypothetical protein